jgi:type IV pilus assembly protein PilA
MEKKMNNKGFSLVELIIVVAIMAVLIGVLAPAYLQYVEKSKKTTDCTAVGDIMNAIETIAADPAINFGDGITVEIDNSGCTYSGDPTDAAGNACLDAIVPQADVKLSGTWTGGGFNFTAVKGATGTVTFTINSGIATTEIDAISPALSNRF